MQFMMIVKSSDECETGKKPSDELVAAIGNYTQELRRAGVLVEAFQARGQLKGNAH